MNRLLAILVTLFILFLVYLWINHLVGSSKGEEALDENLSEDEALDPQFDKPEEVYHIPDDYVPSDTTVQTQEPPVEAEPEQDEPEARKEVKSEPAPVVQKKEPEPKPTPKTVVPEVKKTVNPTPPPPTKVADKDAGTHLVIAGNFTARANADERVKELKKLGYSKAEVVNFELSEYHTACAGRYSDLNEARRVAKKIKDMHGIDTYVRHGN